MPVAFVCPHCGLETLVDDEYRGQQGPCAACGKVVTIPHHDVASIARGSNTDQRRIRSPLGLMILIVLSTLAAAVLLIAFGYGVLRPVLHATRARIDQQTCHDNLRRIGLALRAYEAAHGTLPPAYIPDENGKPKHSWRVLLLPFLNEQALYARYDFNEPWDGPNNMQFTRRMPAVYGCPSDPDTTPHGETSYMVIQGSQTFFPGAASTSLKQGQDDPATSILVVETQAIGVTWLEPRDLSADRMQFLINGGVGHEIGSHHHEGAHALMADGTVVFLSDSTPADFVEGMTTISGQEPLPLDLIDR